ncbi:MAG: hypothetical protein A2487_16795 [Candidatus Raymondbacteria bacterium RifOxyC12_full_50_8]|uniref:ABC transporter domain-containing protein n=1 Tax=Candidatus Raymondbacteria bacterium RIFOXYD12_FULL_49_13 TaxID=1817890 RepID=A0A1F7F0I0_UNCRA|nr:MAG: hypothetical protein A2248_21670 [Candidatus Raymondbacteria bacterium RIFOXYA2_FULL_49_16]OGK00047.1 MAG: hypothetical protein A2519_22225 [Candidatus Raymondbacteria bacterium RIFOXYD12_FULL_49_13]OGK01337.1 MAG: hypothetical protein A2487_16795 [Candidatus Raymondbacteria bacterium RifOxyC12_full_50_8]OGK03664.1 MAG: hypothetical protein A2350_12905 [Candidatus Raymondbacteria bacterium RifOxyB12_full_50_8]OGP45036.1 MAG: hypothetical protein A2324_13550 [Candidatus Raymondbacteria b
MENGPVLRAEELRKSYREGASRLEVLKGASLSLRQGEMVALVGESGSGKTTLLNLLGSLDKPDSGLVHFINTEITGLAVNELASFRSRHIGFLFQFHYLLADFTALENVIIPGLIAGKDRDGLLRKGSGLLKQVGLADRLHHCPAELSGGEQQRVAAVRAIINDPLAVLADEPAGNLDERNSALLIDMLFDLRSERDQTFLIATHSRSLAERCDRILYLKNGTIGDTP